MMDCQRDHEGAEHAGIDNSDCRIAANRRTGPRGSGYSFEDGSGLLRLCRRGNNLDRGVCHNYLAGIHDAQGSFAHAGLLGKRHF